MNFQKRLADVMQYIDEDNDGSITFKELDQGLRESDVARKDAMERRAQGYKVAALDTIYRMIF